MPIAVNRPRPTPWRSSRAVNFVGESANSSSAASRNRPASVSDAMNQVLRPPLCASASSKRALPNGKLSPQSAQAATRPRAARLRSVLFETADVLGNTARYGDVEAGLARNPKARARAVLAPLARAVEPHAAGSRRDVHALRRVGPEVKLARVDQTQGFLGTVREAQGVTDDLAVEIDVGLGNRCDVMKFHLSRHHRSCSNPPLALRLWGWAEPVHSVHPGARSSCSATPY